MEYKKKIGLIDSQDALYGNIKGSLVMMSPELCNIIKLRFKKRKWSQNISGKMLKASDVWSLGIFTFYLIAGKHPFLKRRSKSHQKLRTLKSIINHK